MLLPFPFNTVEEVLVFTYGIQRRIYHRGGRGSSPSYRLNSCGAPLSPPPRNFLEEEGRKEEQEVEEEQESPS